MTGPTTTLLALPPEEAHLWYLFPEQLTESSLLDAYAHLMTAEETERCARYVFEKGRREYLLTRALVRTTLSRYVEADPGSWRFSANAYGRPEIRDPVAPWLRFNLSNTEGLIACIVVRDREAGVDVENTERHGQTVEIADSFFSASEVAALRSIPSGHQRSRFFDYWTLKEAYIKARGMGLSIPLDQFSFRLVEGRPIGITFDPRLPDDPRTWQFDQFRPSRRHRVATAIRVESGAPAMRIVERTAVPLAD